jgi:site-specific recombinase XerD
MEAQMSTAPVITIFVRHSADCKYLGDEFSKRCDCRKHFRWTAEGVQHRKKAGTRSWAEAEELKRKLEDQLAGRSPERAPTARTFQDCIDVFLRDKRLQGLTANGMGKYTRELERLRVYCEGEGVFTVQGITRESLTDFAGTWEALYPSSFTRSKLRERYRSFFRYCYEAQWLPRIPVFPKIKIDVAPTMPLMPAEFNKLLAVIPNALTDPTSRERCRALFLLMRWSGLAIMDALMLRRDAVHQDTRKGGLYRVVTSRQKTGTHVSVPVPEHIATEILELTKDNSNPAYLFWTGNGKKESLTCRWSVRYVAPVFKAAGLHESAGNMVSHRLRDTFAVGLLEKGVPLEEVSKLLGHESIKTTERHYSKWVQGRQDRLDALVVGTWVTPKKIKGRKRGG